MRLAYSPYQLAPLSGGAARSGALLRVEFAPDLVGYADVHPWTEFGDADLDSQLVNLSRGETTPLTSRSLAMARVDAEARSDSRSLFDKLIIPESHASWPHRWNSDPSPEESVRSFANEGYVVVKLKCDAREETSLAQLARISRAAKQFGIKLRLDFNAHPSLDVVLQHLEKLAELLGRDNPLSEVCDWLEDPCPYEPEAWQRIAATTGVRLALDLALPALVGPIEQEVELPGVDVLVGKPAVQSPEMFFQLSTSLAIPVAITSYLDHPVGQLGAAWVAASAVSQGFALERCGLASQLSYAPNPYSEQLSVASGRLVPPCGFGIGFDALLANENWRPLPQ